MSLNRFVFYGEWVENIKDMPLEVQDKIIAEIVRYGIEKERKYEDDSTINAIVNFTKGAIDKSKEEYLKKVEAGQNYGRKKKVNDRDIYDLAQQGKKAKEIANILGIKESSVYHSEGWENRNKELEFEF